MLSGADFRVFQKWQKAPLHAFGSQNKPSVVPMEDKVAFGRIFDELLGAATKAWKSSEFSDQLRVRPMRFSPEHGSRGQCPKDLWVSICGADTELLKDMPQIYAIASVRGLEIGFAASIHESDYYDEKTKVRSRIAIPMLNSKLPAPGTPVATRLETLLAEQGGWHFNSKTRLTLGATGFDNFSSLSEMLGFLRNSGSETGGGTACRIFTSAQVEDVDIDEEFRRTLLDFYPLMAMCRASAWDIQILETQQDVSQIVPEPGFNPKTVEDAREKVLADIARRQGQGKFRSDVLKAYGGKCAITGTALLSVLEAAHITPYLGPATNHVTNGILLRTDIHTLFDLYLLKIDPDSLTVLLAPVLKDTEYGQLQGRQIRLTSNSSTQPSKLAL